VRQRPGAPLDGRAVADSTVAAENGKKRTNIDQQQHSRYGCCCVAAVVVWVVSCK
jgi:hypothetical protein